MVSIRQNLVQNWNYNNKCPYTMNPTTITVHNTANDAPAWNEVNYMINNTNEVSFHYAVDDKEIVQGIPEDRNTWHAGDGGGNGNMKSISIEICYSKSGGDKFIQAEKNAAEFVASLLKRKGWGIDRVKKHQDWNGKYCPHRTLDMGWERFLNMVKGYMNVSITPTPSQIISKPSNTTSTHSKIVTPIIKYGVKTKKHGILPDVKNREDYAGWDNSEIVAIKIGVNVGSVKYRVHTLNGQWLEYVTGNDWNDYNNGYAGDDKNAIDAIEVYYNTDTSKTGGKYYRVKYQVKGKGNKSYWDNQYDNEKDAKQDGYAGAFGVPIVEVMMNLE